MRLSQHELAVEWLRQFNSREIYIARLLLDSLKLVSFAALESSISRSVTKICDDVTGTVALFPVDEDAIRPSRLPGSGGRVGHLLTNLERLQSQRVLVRPSQEEMRRRRIRHIVLVDDFVGSGTRVQSFWNAWATRTLKSWLSYKVCTLWIVAYAVHETGLNAIFERITYLTADRVRSDIQLGFNTPRWPELLVSLCEEVGKRTYRRRTPLGFGNIMCPLVFQYGCPNNAPAILWSNGKSWRALFPERGIPESLYACFAGRDDAERSAPILKAAGQPRLASGLLEALAHGRHNADYIELLTLLGLLLRGVLPKNLSLVTTMEESTIQRLLLQANQLGLVDSQDHVTLFGRDIVNRSRSGFLGPAEIAPTMSQRGIDYIPLQFCGVQRPSRNASPR
ncbi:MAG: phosphoribosyltransferase-like protein [Chthoniobacterales bacterium]